MPYIRRVPEDYATIALAHSAAESGDIIYITGQPTEVGIVTITKAVHLIGAGGLTDMTFNSTTCYGLRNAALPLVSFNLSAIEAAKVPFLLVENLIFEQIVTNNGRYVVTLTGVAPENGIVFNRCRLVDGGYACFIFNITSVGWKISLDRCYFYTGGAGSLCAYNVSLLEGIINKCFSNFALSVTDLTQNWTTKDLVTTQTTGYGPVPTDGIVLRMDDLDYETYRIYGTVTDIPNFVDPEDFEIRLFPEKTAQGNDMGLFPLESIPLTLATQGDDTWTGSWEFNYLLPTRRYGVLINPPDGMQGHWLRWYNPSVE